MKIKLTKDARLHFNRRKKEYTKWIERLIADFYKNPQLKSCMVTYQLDLAKVDNRFYLIKVSPEPDKAWSWACVVGYVEV